MALNILDYYDYNVAKGTTILVKELWTTGAHNDITIQPGTDDSDFVESITFLASDDFAVAGGTVRISNLGYALTTYIEFGSLAELIGLGDPEYYKSFIVGTIPGATTNYHLVCLKFKPPKYLRSSTTPAESLEITLETIANISAGTLEIVVKGWEIEEDNSGIGV